MSLSDILSTISLVFYSIVYFPQFYEIFKTKSSNGISIWTLILWTQADALSLFGTILLYLPLNFIIIAWYHFLIGVVLIITILIYRKTDKQFIKKNIKQEIESCNNNTIKIEDDVNDNDRNMIEIYASLIFIFINVLVGALLNGIVKEQYHDIGSTFAWATMILYLVGRFPQIYTTWKMRSTEGLSLLMYIFTILGNGFYIGVILVSPEYLTENIPWLITSIFSILLDFIVVYFFIRNF